ncbi:MAG TPA: tetratricopeptide repeat protein [Gammaproteobacteria bacterium]|nr:tetratricopeptide repeat protein [Gammaproteobacteria bacterium]
MSLINDMLRDLDKRRARSLERPDGVLHNLDLGAGMGPTAARRRALYGLIALLAAVVLGGAAYLAWERLAPRASAGSPVASASHPAPAAAPKPKPAAAPVPASAPAPAPREAVVSPARVAAAVPPAPSAAAPSHGDAASPVKHSTVRQRARAPTAEHHRAETRAGTGVDLHKRRRPMTADQRSELAYQRGYRLLGRGDTSRGEEQLRQALKADPRNLRARELLAGVYMRAGRLVEAAGLLKQGVHLAPDHTVFAKLYARVLLGQGRAPAAVEVLERHLGATHNDIDYLAMLAALYQRVGRQREAAQAYRQLVKVRPNRGDWWVGLGISLEALGKPAAARQAYQRARATRALSPELEKYAQARLITLKASHSPAD